MPDSFWMHPHAEDRLLAQARQRRAEFAGMVRNADENQARRAAELTTRHPNAAPGVIDAIAQEGLDDEQAAQVAGLDGGEASGVVGNIADFVTDIGSGIYEQGIKPLIRGTFLVADTLKQELVDRPLTAATQAEGNLLTNPEAFGRAYDAYGDSPGRNYLQGELAATDEQGNEVEGGTLGTGFFAGGQAAEQSRQEQTLQVDGMDATLGRALTSHFAGDFLDPGSTAYNTVAGVTQFASDVLLDPLALVTGGSASLARQAARAGVVSRGSRAHTALGGGAAGLYRASRKLDPAEASDILRTADEVADPDAATTLLDAAGGLKANGRSTALVEKATDFFGKREVISKLAESDAYTIYQSFKRSAANQLDTSLVRALGNATDETEVSRVLLDAVQRGDVTEKGFYSGLTGVRRRINNTKLGGTSPRGRIDVDDLPDAVDKIDSFMRQAKVGRDDRASVFNRLIDLEDADPLEKHELFFDVVEDAMARVTANLDGDVESIVEATRMMRGDIRDLREYGIDDAGDIISTPMFRPKVDPGTGEQVATVGPQLTSELAKVGMELPDVTAIRRAAKRSTNMQNLYNSAGWKVGSDAARFATRDLFKPLAILRPAYVVRIGLEEQLRLAGAGYDSIFTHPLRFIQANVMARATDTSLVGDSFEEVATSLNAINRRAHNVMSDPVQGRAREFTQMTKPASGPGDQRYLKAWQHELAQLSAAREARWLARNGGDIDGFVDWARNSAEGRSTIERIARISDEAGDLLTSDEAVREWGSSINARLAAKAGGEIGEDGVVRALGDADVLDSIATGKMANVRLSNSNQNQAANLHRLLRSKWEKGPQRLKVELDDPAMAAKQQNRARKAVDYLFDNITGKPTNYLARYPAFRQAYVKRAGELMGSLSDDAARTSFARQIDDSLSLTKIEKETLVGTVVSNAGKRGFFSDLTELDEVVKLKAAEEVKELLFDVTRRSNIQDSYEVAVPFFDAWLEVTRTWGRLVKENPAFFIKAQQGYQSLRDSGVVYANDFGEEVFAYPGGGMLSKLVGNDDASLRLEGRVQGANLVAQGVGPGFGPMVQWATGALMPTTEEWDEVREWVAPFGTGGVESASDLANPGALMESFIPAWARKGVNAVTSGGIDETQWNSTVGDAMKVLAESGRYDPANPEARQQLIEDAKRTGKYVLLLRSFTQATAITGASATWELSADIDESAIPEGWDPEDDPDGQWHTLGVMSSELHRLAEFYDYDWQAATGKFVEMYGVEPHYITQSKSRSLTEAPVTAEGDYWMQANEDFVDRNRAVAGYFVPPEENPELDYSVYRRQFESGDRQSLTVEQQYELANQTRARSMFYAAKDLIESQEGISSQQRTRALSQVRAMLDGQFPNWQHGALGVGDTLTTGEKIERLNQAVYDPQADASPVTEPLRDYLMVRDQLLEVAAQRGFQSLNNQGSADLRQRLDIFGQAIADQRAEFMGVWSQLLSREVQDA